MKNVNRRNFVKRSGTTILGSTLGFNILTANNFKHRMNSETLKVGLIGCGGRGTGAALQATLAEENVVLTVMADAFQDRLDKSHKNLMLENPEKIMVDKEHRFIGFDAYKKVMETDVDVVILTTPPCFRPGHLEEAIEAGKHVFAEKPLAVDAPGIRRVVASAKKAKEKGLSFMSGFCWRHDIPKIDTYKRLLDGGVGTIHTAYNTYNTGALWSFDRKKEWSDMEYQMRNWLYYNWMSGDHIMEQAIHSIDLMSWAFGDELPVSAIGTGGRQVRVDPKFGNIYDHFAVVYEYADGRKGIHFSRQQKDTARAYHVEALGDQGKAYIDVFRKHQINGKENWQWKGEKSNMYQNEHNTLFKGIREGNYFNDGEVSCNSTMLALMGRMVAYTGQKLTWDDVYNNDEILSPKLAQYNWDMNWPMKDVAKPGITQMDIKESME